MITPKKPLFESDHSLISMITLKNDLSVKKISQSKMITPKKPLFESDHSLISMITLKNDHSLKNYFLFIC